jgi:hypothetical protein
MVVFYQAQKKHYNDSLKTEPATSGKNENFLLHLLLPGQVFGLSSAKTALPGQAMG